MKKLLILTSLFIVQIKSEFVPENHKNWNLLPHDVCGHVNSDRIIGGEEAPMNAYPWLVRIGYASPLNVTVSYSCGGVIANSHTIVTAAHCVTNLPHDNKVKVILLGEHNTKTDPDCEGDYCADPVVYVHPKEIITPKNYDSPKFQNDISIIRLHEKINFTAFIKPICFPNYEISNRNLIGSVTEVAGWGVYNITTLKTSEVLQVVKLRVVENEICSKHFPFFIKIGHTQLCVGGGIGKDSCNGDSGGPLMMVADSDEGPRYYLLGIVSFGPTKCGETNVPGIYTKMSSFMGWLLDNLEITKDNSKTVF